MKGYRFVNPRLEPLRTALIVAGTVAVFTIILLAIRPLVTTDSIQDNSISSTEALDDGERDRISIDQSDDSEHYSEVSEEEHSEEQQLSVIKMPESLVYYSVVHVRDGDTIDILYNGQKTGVRLIGVDTPESVHPDKPIECFGLEASNYTKNKLSGQTVGLEFDDTQGMYDAYGRLLAYVYLNGDNYNLDLIKNGYALEYTYDMPYKYQQVFKDAQAQASNSKVGLWASCR